ncbi:hypothetical protein SD70_29740 [Gordoniibacillus kamchatkensis]|uniref:Recombinase family protein n=1 Tax=Gordoniibacillus kamchatkensis TaxID=1590651 RepID=A0ABR5AB95_9BACL|nr:recombinase family protein [Paenibacillus sp. VKM B-2647]KIL37968.1 hypothetical protein SD70_29740 [Paenibacillus sp. VKM B-2647]
MKALKTLDVAIYIRKSRSDVIQEKEAAARGESYDTLSKHRTELLALAKREGFNVIDIFEELVSGEYIAERPEMQTLLANVKSMKYDAVLVMDIDRLGRGDKMDQGRIERAFKESDTLIITPSEQYNMNEESGEFGVEVKTFLARMEYKQIRRRLTRGKIAAAKSGKELATKAPYGYRKGKNGFLVINEEEAKIVRQIYAWCLEGFGRVKIAEMLTEMNIPSPRGKSGGWSHVTVRKILSNPKYKGDQVNGRVKWTKQEDGTYKTKKIDDPNKWIVVKNAHPYIIDPEIWDKVQLLIKERITAPVRQDREMINMFATVLRCKKCGNAMVANNPTERNGIWLFCNTPRCYQKRIATHKVEQVMLEQIEKILIAMKSQSRFFESEKNDIEAVVQLSLKRIEKIKEEIQKENRRKSAAHEAYEDGIYDKETFLERMNDITSKTKHLEVELIKAEQKANLEMSRLQSATSSIPRLENGLIAYRKAINAEEKNKILKSIIKVMRYNRERHWKGPFEFELEIELHDQK